MKILSIESSCDDSALAYTDMTNSSLLWHTKVSQERVHKIYGGVVPELASRLFVKDLPFLFHEFKNRFDCNTIDCIAVTYEPGLSTSLLEGVMMAKALAISYNIPLLGINHLKGHIYSLFINQEREILPLSVLLVSGGHTMIIECYSYDNMKIISHTLDDSFGECYDKAAKMLALGYPGGPIIDSIAKKATENNILPINLPIPLAHHNTLNFSFSGLKNAFRLKLQEHDEILSIIESAHILQEEMKSYYDTKSLVNECDTISYERKLDSITQQIQSHPFCQSLVMGLQQSATTHIWQKCEKYFTTMNNIQHFAIVGGASANSCLRQKIQMLCKAYNKTLLLSELCYCSDNAAMIGRAAIAKIKENPKVLESSFLHLDVSARNTEI